MDIRAAEAGLDHYYASLGKLRAARKALKAGPLVGLAGIDEAIAAYEEGALAFAEEIAARNWWNPTDAPAIAGLIPRMAELVGVAEGGPVSSLGETIGRLSRPRCT